MRNLSLAIALMMVTDFSVVVAFAQQPAKPMIAEYSTEAEAKRTCGSDPVVWANLESKVLHAPGDQWYGKTKKGAYVCESAATKAGMHMEKSKG